MTFFRAEISTRHFDFEAYGATAEEARVALHRGLLRHKCAYMPGVASILDAREMADDATVYAIEIGQAYRDREPIKAAG